MITDIKDVKTCIMGIQGSGKTELGKKFAEDMKKSIWVLINLDDAKGMPKNVKLVSLPKKSFEEMDELCKVVIDLGKQNKCNCLIIDEADMLIPKNIEKLQKFRSIHDLLINHRHYGLAVVFMTRRPQDLITLVVESSEHSFIFALPNSDNIYRKMKHLDDSIPEMMKDNLTKANHRFIHKKLGDKPILMEKITIREVKK